MGSIADGSQFSADQLIFPYKEYSLTTRYIYNSGCLQIPLAPAPSVAAALDNPILSELTPPATVDGIPEPLLADRVPAVVIQVSEPWGRKIVSFRAVRQTIQPVLPDPTPTNTNETLLSAEFDLKAPKLVNNGQSYEWTAEGTMVYALAAPYWTKDGLSGGATPVDVSGSYGNAIDPLMYDSELPGNPLAVAPPLADIESTILAQLTD